MNLRTAALAFAAVLAGAAASAVLVPEPAEALATGEVLGTWTLRLRVDGWAASAAATTGADPAVDVARGTLDAVMRLLPRDAQVNDGLVRIEISLPQSAAGTPLGRATPGSPSFRGVAAIVGDSIAAIDSGTPNYVNAVSLKFDRTRRKVAGTWFAAFPASEPRIESQGFAAGVTATVAGKRSKRFDPRAAGAAR